MIERETKSRIACFSGKPDDLNQWRAYGKSIPGYSIGFEWGRLTQLVNEKHGTHTEVKYIENIGKQYLEDYVKKYTKHPEDINVYGSEAIYKAAIGDSIADALALGDQIIGAEYKHRGLIPKKNSGQSLTTIFNKVGKENWKFYTHQTFLKPFIEFHIGKDQIKDIVKEVWVGPSPNRELAIEGAKMFLTHLGFRNVDNIVKGSVIPFRNW